ncbi:MAG: flagellar filament capping protein FliD [Deltaproteobacteria bacterium]|nr:flagellar filament capping protein FliD [Deltaproteobacteria bacterium]
MTIQFTNLGAFDYGTIIDQLVALKQTSITAIEDQQSDLNTKGKLIDQLSAKLSTLQDTADDISEMDDFLSYSTSSSSESKVTVSSTGIAQPTSFDVQVTSLAKSTKTYSNEQSAKDLAGVFGSGTMDIKIGGSVVGTITVDGSSTMESIVKDINLLNTGVQASVFYDGTDYRILAVGKDTGLANDVEFEEFGTTIGLDTATTPYREAAQDASVIIDNTYTVTSSSNEFTGIVEGLSFEVHDETSVGESVEIRVDPDADATSEKVQGFIDAYNSVASFLNYQLSYSGTVKGPDTLFGDSTSRGIQSRLSSLITSQIGGLPNEMSALSMIGVKTQNDGTLSFDTAEFKEQLEKDPEAVSRLFANDSVLGTEGIGSLFSSTIDGYIDTVNGSLVAKKDGISATVKRMDETIEAMERRLEDYESMLYKQFEAMNSAVSDLEYQASYLSNITTSSS